jgi:hypothetical protein
LKFTIAFIALLVSISAPVTAEASISISREMSGSFITNVRGSSVTRPPYIQVIRSREGLEYTLSRFERFMKKVTQRRIDKLRKRLSNINYEKNMLVCIFSQPMDNFDLKIKSLSETEDGSAIEAFVSYRHKIKNIRIPPFKSIHYVMALVPKSDLPVILRSEEIVSSKNKKDTKKVTVTGRLMLLNNGTDLQLVPVVIKRGSKSSYYVRGAQAEPLLKHVGKVVTLQGAVSIERDSPYEWDLTVARVVKIY